MSSSQVTSSATQAEGLHKRRRLLYLGLAAGLTLPLVGGLVFYFRNADRPLRYEDIDDHFKYGSIGSDRPPRGLSLEVLEVLPETCAEYLPPGGPRDYTAFGFVQEPGHRLPIGFSLRRQVLVNLAGLNCAACHVTTVRESPESPPRLYLATPANTVDLQGFFTFLFNCATDERFTADNLLYAIQAHQPLGPLQRWVLRHQVIPRLKEGLLAQRDRLGYLTTPGHPPPGPGRVDTFTPYKALIYHFPMSELPGQELIGTADFTSIWNQGMRKGMWLHWDGNNNSVRERNLSAAFGAGATPVTVDLDSIGRLEQFLDALPPPPYPFPIDAVLAEQGAHVYRQHCYPCHAGKGFGPGSQARSETRVGQVEPLERIRTDPYRLLSFTPALAVHQATLMADRPEHRLRSFRTTNGYSNVPLDGIWLRAPYLHNGSVPTLRDLLSPPGERPAAFYRGYDVYDPGAVGFVSNVAEERGRSFFLYRTRDASTGQPVPGNSNEGHEYGTRLPAQEKQQLLEYLKTL